MKSQKLTANSLTVRGVIRILTTACFCFALLASLSARANGQCAMGFLKGSSIADTNIDGITGGDWDAAAVLKSSDPCLNPLRDWDGATLPPTIFLHVDTLVPLGFENVNIAIDVSATEFAPGETKVVRGIVIPQKVNPPNAGAFKHWGLSLHAGISIPHGNFDTFFNPGPNFGVDLEYRITRTFSLESIYGLHHFRGATIGSVTIGNVNACTSCRSTERFTEARRLFVRSSILAGVRTSSIQAVRMAV